MTKALHNERLTVSHLNRKTSTDTVLCGDGFYRFSALNAGDGGWSQHKFRLIAPRTSFWSFYNINGLNKKVSCKDISREISCEDGKEKCNHDFYCGPAQLTTDRCSLLLFKTLLVARKQKQQMLAISASDRSMFGKPFCLVLMVITAATFFIIPIVLAFAFS